MRKIKQTFQEYPHLKSLKARFLAHRSKIGAAAAGTALAMLIVVGLQLVYPSERTLPFTQVSDLSISSSSREALSKILDTNFKEAVIEVKAAKKTYKLPAADIGLSINTAETVQAAIHYPLVQRLVPFSILKRWFNGPVNVVVRTDEAKLQYFADQVQKENYTPPINAGLTVEGEAVVVSPSKTGKDFKVETTVETLKNIDFKNDMKLTLNPSEVAPARSSEDVQPLVKKAEELVNLKLSINLDGEQIKLNKKTIASFISFSENKQTKVLDLAVNEENLKKYLNQVQAKIYIKPGVTVVNLVDGNEVSRVVGANGQGIDQAAVLKSLQVVFKTPQSTTIEAPLAVLPPSLSYNRSYTQTQAGLNALLKYIAEQKGDFAISVTEMSGQRRVANANGGKRYITASTYKLFVAYSVLKKIESSEWKWSDKIEDSKSIETCFDLMIVQSDNPCAEAFGEKIGWTVVQNQMRGLGLSSTDLGKTFYSTANDEALFLKKLQDGSLLKSSSRTKLLDAMKRQVYRGGIPAGTGQEVADKVGFLEGYLHDAGIVYSGDKTYVLVILSYGSSWGEIADAARQIQEFFK